MSNGNPKITEQDTRQEGKLRIPGLPDNVTSARPVKLTASVRGKKLRDRRDHHSQTQPKRGVAAVGIFLRPHF